MMLRLIRYLSVIFILIGVLIVFFYTPFYSDMVMRILNGVVPVEVNQVAAESQQMGALSENDDLEPGSALWIARQAYLKVMEEAIRTQNSHDLVELHARYQVLQQEIKRETEQNKIKKPDTTKVPFLIHPKDQQAHSEPNIASGHIEDLLVGQSKENSALMQKYIKFLKTHPVELKEQTAIDDEIYKDIAYVNTRNNAKNAGEVRKDVFNTQEQPNAIVVLGGGLTLDKNRKDIIINEYTRLRLEKTLEVEKETHLPIVLSGVEAPYMQAWLAQRGIDAKLLENKSMNTCENTRFSSLLLQKQGGAPKVFLVTDRYHMPRTRRLFALNGIETLAVEAPMPTPLTTWQPSQQNYDHSRRANYELLASLRDMLFGSSGCREVP
ncbi:YdcF family protein [Acinetobacter rudis]|uniref:YdcF family protein n=1 Tax=Acinetobacter rudis TaxID=632955 RepID=A0AAW8JG51_9GAMM|nr:YdcF family protein [Acinetobacter rudis]MDQ8936699.1 YdcF family protein [Acinetobacter rudis]MDQ8954070.1 YdcF family protein [Acinetobacter rudis]MDQ9018920.1 YdcF family protein [Acinetobacter rudis]